MANELCATCREVGLKKCCFELGCDNYKAPVTWRPTEGSMLERSSIGTLWVSKKSFDAKDAKMAELEASLEAEAVKYAAMRNDRDAWLRLYTDSVIERSQLKAELDELRKQGTFDEGVEAAAVCVSEGFDPHNLKKSEIMFEIRQLKRTPPEENQMNKRYEYWRGDVYLGNSNVFLECFNDADQIYIFNEEGY